MKKLFPLLSLILLLTACGGTSTSSTDIPEDVSSGGTPIGGDLSGGENTSSAPNNKNIEYSPDAIDMKTATENYKADFEACKAADYPNLRFENTEAFPVAVVEKCRDLERISTNDSLEIGRQTTEKQKVEKLKEFCGFFLGSYDEEWAGFNSLDVTFDSKPPVEIDGFTYALYDKVTDHIEEIENEDLHINWFVYIDPYKKKFLWHAPLNMKYPFEFNNGEAAVILKSSQKGRIGIQTGLSEYGWDEPVARYFNNGTNNDVTYRLADGDCSIGEAIEYFTNAFREALPFDPEDKQPYLVRYIDVFPMTDDTYAFFIRFSPTVGAPIPFERSINKSGGGTSVGGSQYSSSLPNEISVGSQALMIKKNEIDMAREFAPKNDIHETGGEITKIIPLQKAIDTVSKKISKNTVFDVVETDLVYHGMIAADNDSSAVLKPTWLIRLFNRNDDSYYITYVDAVSGDLSIYRYT